MSPKRVPIAADTPAGDGLAQEESGGVDGMHSHIGQRAAARELSLYEPARRAPVDVHAVAARLHHLAQLTRVDPLAQRAHVGMESPAVSHHQPRPGSLGGSHHQLPLGRGHRHRLLHQDVLSRLQEGDRLRRVQGVGCGDHDRIHLAVSHQLLPLQGGARDPVALSQRRQRRGSPVGGCNQLRRRDSRSPRGRGSR